MPKDNDERRRENDLVEAIQHLACELKEFREQVRIETETMTILNRIERKIDTMAATQAELVVDLRKANEQLRKLIADTAGIQPSVDALLAKIAELEALVVAGAAVSQELIDAVAETKTLAQAVDDNVPELPTPPQP